MNNSIAKYTPKTKTYGMTISITNRVMIAMGVSNLGAELLEARLFKARHSNVTRNNILPPKSRQITILSINRCEENGGEEVSNEYTKSKNKRFDGETKNR